jgi:uncharacterized protein (UPF0332 family)
MMDVEECFEKGLLKKDKKDAGRALKSIEAAKRKVEIAKKIFAASIFEESLVNCYSAMFHASRALLFRDGVKERSHYAVYVYLMEMYRNKIEAKFLNEFNRLRIERHELVYGLEKPHISREETKEIIAATQEFIAAIETLI